MQIKSDPSSPVSLSYQIMVQGSVDLRYLPILGDVSLNQTEVKTRTITTLSCEIADQCALGGIINTLIDNRYTIISVLKIEN